MTHYLALGVCIILVPIAQTLIKMGSNTGGAFIGIARHLSTLAGLAILIVVTLLSTYSFQIVEMKTSAAWTSLNYILVVLASRYALGECVSFSRWIGCGLIATGIIIFQFA
jgi:uncharacterized membrane protein